MKKLILLFVLLLLLCTLFSFGTFAEDASATNEVTLSISDETNAEAGTYTWADALAYVKANASGKKYKLALAKDITVDAQVTINTPVDLTVDLCGNTLTSSVDTLKFASGSKGSVLSYVTSAAGGTLNNGSKSPILISTSNTPFTFNFGSDDTKPLTVNSNMLVTTSSAFKGNKVANINIFEGTYTLRNGIYQVYVTAESPTGAIYKVTAKDATLGFNSRLIYNHNASTYGTVDNAGGYMHLTNCKIVSNTNGTVTMGNNNVTPYKGEIVMTGCRLESFVFDAKTAEAKSITFGEGCTLINSPTILDETTYAFSQENTKCADGCVIVNADDGIVRIMKESDAARVEFVTPVKTETTYWQVGSTPKYTGNIQMTIGENDYRFTFPTIVPATLEGARYEGKVAGGPSFHANLTLHSSIDFNVYVPYASEIVKINGKLVSEYEALQIGDITYAKVSIQNLAPKDAYKTQTITLTVASDDTTIDVERYVSLLSYAKSLLANTTYINESSLVIALLGYIKATSHYFGTATEASDAALDALIENRAIYEWDAEDKEIFTIPENLTKIKGVSLNLDEIPGFVVCVAKGVERVSVGGTSYTVNPENITTINGEEVCYVVTQKNAFGMLDAFDIIADGEMVHFNLDTYIDYMNNPSYAGALYGYAAAAKAYLENPKQEHMLNGKKIIFIGNSYIYWGKTVLESSAKTQAERQNDQGYFYQLCKKMGANVEVTNWTFGGHGIGSIFADECTHCSYDHKTYLQDRYYDYVVVSPGAEANFDQKMATVMDFFREANPNVKFIVMGTACAYGYNSTYSTEYIYQKDLLAGFEDQGILIADWGGLMDGILRKEYTVPNATQEYSINSFIVKDGKHGTMLTGYIQSMLIYSLLTGESATTLPYSFCMDTSIRAEFDADKFISKNTTETYGTNFVEIFNSKADMNGLAQLVDWVLKNKPYRNNQ